MKTIVLAIQEGRVVLQINDIELHMAPEIARKIAEKLPDAADQAEGKAQPAQDQPPSVTVTPWPQKAAQVIQ